MNVFINIYIGGRSTGRRVARLRASLDVGGSYNGR